MVLSMPVPPLMNDKESSLVALIDAHADAVGAYRVELARGEGGEKQAALDAARTKAYAALLDALDIPHGFRPDFRVGRASELGINVGDDK